MALGGQARGPITDGPQVQRGLWTGAFIFICLFIQAVVRKWGLHKSLWSVLDIHRQVMHRPDTRETHQHAQMYRTAPPAESESVVRWGWGAAGDGVVKRRVRSAPCALRVDGEA